MGKIVRSTLIFALTASLVFGNVNAGSAKVRKPKLSKSKVTITIGKKKKITVKKAKPKSTKWSLTKKGKKVVSLSKKKKRSVTIRGKKAGTAIVKARIKVKKKTYTRKVKVTVRKKKPGHTDPPVVSPSPVPTAKPSAGPTASPKPSVSPNVQTIQPIVSEDGKTETYGGLNGTVDYRLTADGKEVDVTSGDIGELGRVFNTDSLYQKWTGTGNEISKQLSSGEITILKPNPDGSRTVTVSGADGGVKEKYNVKMKEGSSSSSVTLEMQKDGTDQTQIVVIAGDTITVTGADGSPIGRLQKNGDGSYTVDLDTDWARQHGFEIGRIVG